MHLVIQKYQADKGISCTDSIMLTRGVEQVLCVILWQLLLEYCVDFIVNI